MWPLINFCCLIIPWCFEGWGSEGFSKSVEGRTCSPDRMKVGESVPFINWVIAKQAEISNSPQANDTLLIYSLPSAPQRNSSLCSIIITFALSIYLRLFFRHYSRMCGFTPTSLVWATIDHRTVYYLYLRPTQILFSSLNANSSKIKIKDSLG
jgi:hypothetical protein